MRYSKNVCVSKSSTRRILRNVLMCVSVKERERDNERGQRKRERQ